MKFTLYNKDECYSSGKIKGRLIVYLKLFNGLEIRK